MAIYHFSAQIISRGRGQSAVASASYRSGERLEDERTGEVKFYKRDAQPESMILAPSDSPEWVYDRGRLWNEVESAEKRKDAQLAREINIALPRELSNEHQADLIQNYVQSQFVAKGMVADIAIHRDDQENPHAHVMLTTRTLTPDGFGPKNRDWNNRDLLTQWREQWADHANQALEKENLQDRISHLSHESRGLEQLPTVHLGHVAHEMEQRGAKSDRGTLNRDRQEYNQHVVDLQKYREEKQVLEQERKQKAQRFSTAAERVDLQNASKLLKGEPTFKRIGRRHEQLDQWEKQLHQEETSLRWKDRKIKEASDHHHWLPIFEDKIKQAEQRIENINWLNPLKIKENRGIKENVEKDIAKAKDNIEFHDEKLDFYREKLGFHTKEEFLQVKKQHESEQPGLLEKNQNAHQRIRYERHVLQKAQNAHEKAFVRQTASLYPQNPEMRYMSFSDTVKLMELNTQQGKVIPIEQIKERVNRDQTQIKQLEQDIDRVSQHKSRLNRTEGYLEKYEKHRDIAEKMEKNPFLKGKMLVSKSIKEEFEQALSARDHFKGLLKKEGIQDRNDFKKQSDLVASMEDKVPRSQKEIESLQKGCSLFEGILKGVEQAGREMQREQKRQHKNIKNRQQDKGLER
ncbi:MobQ family relaxase [Pseudalkalibacillus sp. NRS-1564]|uniref:MobQ family relaxase n=1 Tax=Pseudalkalibacillus sp. NRS-1564 TaxID=3233900 RepID=UPI003D2E4477